MAIKWKFMKKKKQVELQMDVGWSIENVLSFFEYSDEVLRIEHHWKGKFSLKLQVNLLNNIT